MARSKASAGSTGSAAPSAGRSPSRAKQDMPLTPGGIAPSAYRDSVGARSMQDTPRHIAERNHYNYVDVEMRGDAFTDLDPSEHAALKHHSALLLYGMRQADQLAELHLETAALLREVDTEHSHPAWRGFFRHARNGSEKAVSDAFLASCLGAEGALADFDWQSVSEFIRSEWVLYNWRGTAGIAPQAADEATILQWFSDPDFQVMVLLGLSSTAKSAGDMNALAHHLGLLKSIAPAIHDLCGAISVPDAFLVVMFREALIRHTQGPAAAGVFLNEHWTKLVGLDASKISPMAHLTRLKTVYEMRASNASAASDEAAGKAAHEQWREVLTVALERFRHGELS